MTWPRQLPAEPNGTLTKARANIDTLRRAHPGSAAQRWIELWQTLLDGPIDSLLDILTFPSGQAIELRQNSPFAGVLSEQERQTALASFRAHWCRDHVA